MSTEPDETVPVPTNAEDAKRFKAMSNVESATGPAEDEDTTSASNKDQEALGKAMADLSVKSKKTTTTTSSGKVKVNQEDVQLIVDEMEISKVKATELLREHGGNVVDTLKAMVVAS